MLLGEKSCLLFTLANQNSHAALGKKAPSIMDFIIATIRLLG
jgi:flagellar basal body-associated protein FliL